MSSAKTPTSPAASATPQGPVKSTAFKGFHVPYILSWKNPQATGILLAETLGIFLVFSSTLSLRLFLRVGFWAVGILSLVELGTRALNGRPNGIVSNYQPSRFLPLSDSFANNVAVAVSNCVRCALASIQHVVDARNPTAGLKLSALCWVGYVLLGFLSLKTLVLVSILSAFTLPPLYLQFKSHVDGTVNNAHGQIKYHANQACGVVHAKAGPQIDSVKKFVGARGGFPSKANVEPVPEPPVAAAKPTAYTSGSSASASAASATQSTPYASGGTSVPGVAGSIPVETKATTTKVPEEIFSKFDSVPTFQGNLPIDQEKLKETLSKGPQ